MPTIAIIGSGIAGLGCAWFLRRDFEVTVFEAGSHIGGHTHTVTVDEAGRAVPVDTGFMVFNHVTYPNLVRLFTQLEVPTQPTDMSFSVQHVGRGLEYCGSSLNHLFAQRRNLLSIPFWRMLLSIDRFNREAVAALSNPELHRLTLAEYVASGGYGDDFLHLYLLPMSSAVWSTPPSEMMRFPASTLLRFFHNHGFLGLHTQHPWWTVTGGARTYVEKLVASFRDRVHVNTPVHQVRRVPGGVEVATPAAVQRFDKVVLACHAPTSLQILQGDATPSERQLLGAFEYEPNLATLHTDASVMPRARRAWSAWNYRLDPPPGDVREDPTALVPSTHYWMNRLQRVSEQVNYFVSINGAEGIDPAKVLRRIPCEHPRFTLRARDAQALIPLLNAAAVGGSETYFAGAWQRYGFHEDGLLSAVNVARHILGREPWSES